VDVFLLVFSLLYLEHRRRSQSTEIQMITSVNSISTKDYCLIWEKHFCWSSSFSYDWQKTPLGLIQLMPVGIWAALPPPWLSP